MHSVRLQNLDPTFGSFEPGVSEGGRRSWSLEEGEARTDSSSQVILTGMRARAVQRVLDSAVKALSS